MSKRRSTIILTGGTVATGGASAGDVADLRNDLEAVDAKVDTVIDNTEGIPEQISEITSEIQGISGSLTGLKSELEGRGGYSPDFPLIYYPDNKRAAIVQKSDGLDFMPSQSLIDRLPIPEPEDQVKTTDGAPLIYYPDNKRVGMYQKSDGLDFVPSQSLIDRLPIPEVNPLRKNTVQISSVNGQSHSTGGPWDAEMTRRYAESLTGPSVLQLDGLRRGDGASAASTNGPAIYGYDHNIPATGTGIGQPGNNNIGLPFATFVTLAAHRRDAGVPVYPVLTTTHGSAGVALADMDSDPNTGNGSLTVWENFTYWTSEAKRIAEIEGLEIVQGWHVFNHGGAGKNFPRGQYLQEFLDLQTEYFNYWSSIGLTQPRYIITQGGGSARTDNTGPGYYANADDQLDAVEMGAAVLGACDYWFPIYDGSGHWDAYQTAAVGETLAWGMAEVEAGRRWSITRPSIAVNDGVIKLHFNSLRDDEHLQLEDSSKYSDGGIGNYYGFELEGGDIDSVNIRGAEVFIDFTGDPTRIKYARQIQNLTGSNYPAHRGLLRTSLRKRSKILDNYVLARAIPSFTMEINNA